MNEEYIRTATTVFHCDFILTILIALLDDIDDDLECCTDEDERISLMFCKAWLNRKRYERELQLHTRIVA